MQARALPNGKFAALTPPRGRGDEISLSNLSGRDGSRTANACDVRLAGRGSDSLSRVTWVRYDKLHPDNTVTGNVRVKRDVGREGMARDIVVYLPPSYGHLKTAHYPVLYMHDGQNVFDAKTSYAGEWGADEAAQELAARGWECVIVAVPNMGAARIDEYGPWRDDKVKLPGLDGGGGRADEYLDYLLEDVKPLVDRSFRVLTDAGHTGLAGSSMGGMISLWCALEAPDVFGFAGCFSPAFWVGKGNIFKYAQSHVAPGLRVYLDCGGREGGSSRDSRAYLGDSRRMREILQAQGCYDLVYLEDEGANHSEPMWRKRFPAVLEWFLNPRRKPKAEAWQ
jgi:predicted alpha/beta superfamily hydrolase